VTRKEGTGERSKPLAGAQLAGGAAHLLRGRGGGEASGAGSFGLTSVRRSGSVVMRKTPTDLPFLHHYPKKSFSSMFCEKDKHFFEEGVQV